MSYFKNYYDQLQALRDSESAVQTEIDTLVSKHENVMRDYKALVKSGKSAEADSLLATHENDNETIDKLKKRLSTLKEVNKEQERDLTIALANDDFQTKSINELKPIQIQYLQALDTARQHKENFERIKKEYHQKVLEFEALRRNNEITSNEAQLYTPFYLDIDKTIL